MLEPTIDLCRSRQGKQDCEEPLVLGLQLLSVEVSTPNSGILTVSFCSFKPKCENAQHTKLMKLMTNPARHRKLSACPVVPKVEGG